MAIFNMGFFKKVPENSAKLATDQTIMAQVNAQNKCAQDAIKEGNSQNFVTAIKALQELFPNIKAVTLVQNFMMRAGINYTILGDYANSPTVLRRFLDNQVFDETHFNKLCAAYKANQEDNKTISTEEPSSIISPSQHR